MRFAITIVCVGLLTATVVADTLVDQLGIVDGYAYDQSSVASVIGGWSLVGGDHDSQVVDDFTVPAPGYFITDVWFDYLAYWGGGAPPNSLIEVFPDVGGRPGEVSVAHEIVGATSTSWTPIVPGLHGERHHASGLAIELAAGHYWIGMQPITIQSWGGNGDIYYPVQDTDVPPAGDTFLREPGIDPDVNHEGSLGFGPLYVAGGLNVPDFITTQQEQGLCAGDSSFRVDGVAVPEPATLTLLAGAAFAFASSRRRRR
ncbi:MAG: PEP-CTERM sorting domain-containing protein [Phycisphaerae bacterium]